MYYSYTAPNQPDIEIRVYAATADEMRTWHGPADSDTGYWREIWISGELAQVTSNYAYGPAESYGTAAYAARCAAQIAADDAESRRGVDPATHDRLRQHGVALRQMVSSIIRLENLRQGRTASPGEPAVETVIDGQPPRRGRMHEHIG